MWAFGKNHLRWFVRLNYAARHVQRIRVSPSLLSRILLIVLLAHGCRGSYEMQGPNFVSEPPSRVEFTNENGGSVDCIVRGNPAPTVDWLAADGGSIVTIPGIRHILGNGTLYFPGFKAHVFRQDVHWAIYKCSAVNSVGAVVSRDVTVRAVVNQRYEPEVQSPRGFLGNNVLMRCNVPSFVRDHVTVTSWLQEPSFNIYPSTLNDGKYHMLPSGELMIINITRSDAQLTYRCRTHHRLTQETVVSTNVGRLQLEEIRGSLPPELSEKVVYVSARLEETVVMPCVAHAYPRATNRWYYNRNQRQEPIEESAEHYILRDGSLIIDGVQENDVGSYMCTASNSEGSETLEVRLTVSAPLSVHVQPAIQTADLGKPAHLTCSASGFPQSALYWLKDGQPLRTGARIQALSKERISVTLVAREDRGMYQCFVRNEYEMAQGIAELRLGEIAPQLVYRFIEQTMQPGPSVSLKCSAAGNPTPQISWLLDGFPLPQNDRLLIGQYVTVYGDVISHVNISSVKPEDGGEYECTASSRAGQVKHSARLNIYGLPYVRAMSTVSAVAGKQLHIKCPVAGYPIDSIKWEKDGVKLPTNMRQRVANGTLFIDTVQNNADQGTYTCTARNKHNFTSQRSVDVRVLVPPKITPFSFARDLNVGDRTSIQCVVVTGDLPLTFTWLKDNVPIEKGRTIDEGSAASLHKDQGTAGPGGPGGPLPNNRIRSSRGHGQGGLEGPMALSASATLNAQLRNARVGAASAEASAKYPSGAITIRQYDPFNSALSISTIAPAHNGTYTCRVTNGAATVAHSALLHVNVPPRISPFFFGNGVMEGETTQLMCTASQGDRPFNITWLIDDKPIDLMSSASSSSSTSSLEGVERRSQQTAEPYSGIQISNYSPFSSILTIASIAEHHSGNYTCQISNVAGLAEHSTSLSVTVPPRWTVEPIDQNAIVGHAVSIACQAEGFPVPAVTWKQSVGESPGDYRELGYGGTEGAGVAGNGSLVIPRVSRDHAGFYLCQANNGIGPALSKLIRLTVHAGPRVTVRARDESVRRGESVTLHCEAEGDAPLDLSWRARGSRVDPNYDVRYNLANSVGPHGGGIVELRIIQASHMDRGEYLCMASNAYGHDKASVRLLVQEPPNFPRNLHVAEQSSRSILLAWSSPSTETDSSHPSAPITNYIVQYKEAQDVWHEHNAQKLVAGDSTVALVSPLKPATTYHFRVLAKNHLGTSAPSDILHVQTDGEIPGGPPKHVSVEPLGPQQLKVTWQPPDRALWNGELLGYTISYTNLGDDQSVNTTRVGITGNGDGTYDYRLGGLRKYTRYSIIVKAFNSKGDGPGSDPVVAQTFEDVPSAPPQNVGCTALTGENIQVTWKPPPSDKVHGVVQGYTVLYEATSGGGSASESLEGSRETKIIPHALSTVLYSLTPYTNYTVQVLAFTKAGEGVSSSPIICTTDETVPDAPERVKAVASGEDSVVISWLPPRRPNGVLTKYTVYIRILDQGQEVKISKVSLGAHNLYHELTGLNLHESYEAWVAASTKVGAGPSTPVIKLQPSSAVAAAIISFGVAVVVPWKVNVNMACLSVGVPRPTVEWRRADVKLQQNANIGPDNALTLKYVQRNHEGNYSCHVKNSLGFDEITYTLQVQVPPTPPTLLATGTTTDAVQLQWKQGDNGGATIKGFLLAYRRQFAEWEEVMLDRRASTHLLEGLLCGTTYQFTLAAFNKIGSGSASKIETAKTNGSKPIPPAKHHLIRANQTFVILELAAWQDGGCPLQYFVVEYRRLPGDWLLVSNNVPPHSKFPIVDLTSGTSYELRVTAYNSAGSTQAEYLFSTLSPSGNIRMQEDRPHDNEQTPLYLDAHVLAPSVISLLAVILAIAGVCFCLKTHPVRSGQANDPTSQSQAALDNKHNMEQREQYYATVRKPGQQSPCREVSALERIPEYSEDIYPYATFNLPEQDNLSANPMRQAYFYERSETMLQSAQCDMEQYTKVRARSRRKSKSFKSESEEYDTLGSDSDTEVGTSSRTESSNHLDDSGPTSIIGRSPGPPSAGGQRDQRLALVPRPVHHNVLYHTHESSTSTEPSPISERKTFPRPEKQRNRGGTAEFGMENRLPALGLVRPVVKPSEGNVHPSYSRGTSPSHPARLGSCERLIGKAPSPKKSFESLCLFEEPDGGGNGSASGGGGVGNVGSGGNGGNGSSAGDRDNDAENDNRVIHSVQTRRKNEEWGSELSTLELKPPTGFTDAHETSEAECDIDMKLRLHKKRTTGLPANTSLSKSVKDFTITV